MFFGEGLLYYVGVYAPASRQKPQCLTAQPQNPAMQAEMKQICDALAPTGKAMLVNAVEGPAALNPKPKP